MSWIPAAILVLTIAGVVIASLVLRGNGLGDPAPAPTVGQVTDLNWSSFTEDGIAYIERSRNIRIDMADGPPRAADLGLESDSILAIGPSDNDDTDNDYYLIVNGGGEGFGGHKFTLNSLSLVTEGGVLTRVSGVQSSTSQDSYLTFREVLNRLTNDVDEFGWPEPDRDALFDQVNAATAQGEGYDFTFGEGDRLGISVSATARCGPDGYCQLEYLVAPVVR